MFLHRPYTRRHTAIRKNIVSRFLTRLLLTLSVIGFLSFGDAIEAGSLSAFLRAFGHSHGHHRSHSTNRERPEISGQPVTNGGESHRANSAASTMMPTRSAYALPEVGGGDGHERKGLLPPATAPTRTFTSYTTGTAGICLGQPFRTLLVTSGTSSRARFWSARRS